MGTFSIWHWIIVIALILVLFGRGKVSELMGDVAKGIKSFKKGMAEDDTAQTKPEPPVVPPVIEHTPAERAAQAEAQRKATDAAGRI